MSRAHTWKPPSMTNSTSSYRADFLVIPCGSFASSAYPRARALPWLVVGLVGALAAGCSDAPAAGTRETRVAATPAPASALVGSDGDLTVSSAGTVLNQYAVLAADTQVADTTLSVTNIADLTSTTYGALAPGDLLLVIQMQGATIDTSNTATYGAVTAYGGAGNYELIGVAGVSVSVKRVAA